MNRHRVLIEEMFIAQSTEHQIMQVPIHRPFGAEFNWVGLVAGGQGRRLRIDRAVGSYPEIVPNGTVDA